MSVIEIKDLSHCFTNGKWGLQDINLTIREGELVIISGKNGSGKTLLARHLNGLSKPTKGQIHITGLDIQQNLHKVRQLVGYVFQDADTQIIGQTISEDVAFGPYNLKLNKSEIQNRVRQALTAVGLEQAGDLPTHFLSGGEKRRVALAGVLAMQPRIIILDEPFNHLDYTGVKQILKQLLQLHQAGYTILVITHDLSTILAYATRLVLMESGRIIHEGSPDKILQYTESVGVRNPLGTYLTSSELTWLK